MTAGRLQRRLLLALLGTTAFLALAPALARANVHFEQCQWGFGTARTCHQGGGNQNNWVTGNPASAGAFRQGDFVPTRFWFDTSGGASDVVLSGHTYTVIVAYHATQQNGFHAYDYLGTVNASPRPASAPILPCSGVPDTTGDHACPTGSVFGDPSTAPVPVDTHSTDANGKPAPPGGAAAAGDFSAWGATLSDIERPHFVNCPQGSGGQSLDLEITMTTRITVTRCIAVTFTVAGNDNASRGVVVAWGAHIATDADWPGRTAALETTGADFHQRLQETPQFRFGDKTLPLGTIVRPGLTTEVAPIPRVIHPDDSVFDTARLTGAHSQFPSGDVRFFVCGPTGAPMSCSSGGSSVGHPEPVTPVLGSSVLGTATIKFPNEHSALQPPLAAGFYCFRAEYIPAVNPTFPSLGAPFLPTSATNATTECFEVVPSTLRVEKICDTSGHFNLHIVGTGVDETFANVPCGEGDVIPVPPGTYTVSEAAGTGTNPADYDPPEFGSTCAGGMVTVALGEDVTCTITNFRRGEARARLTVEKKCVPANDPGVFVVLIGTAEFELRCGQDTGTVALPIGKHTVTEKAGANTSLSSYHTAFSGACTASSGSRTASVELTNSQSVTCTITNTHHGPATATLTVVKRCQPAHDNGRFVLDINEREFHGIRCGHGTGRITVAPGTNLVGEVATPGLTNKYEIRIGGACAADGKVTLRAGQHATCTVTNIRIHVVHPARPRPTPKPPPPIVTG